MVIYNGKKQELNALNFGDDYRYCLRRFPIPATKGSREPWHDEFTFLISPDPMPDSEGIDTTVLNNLMQLVAAGPAGLAINDSLQLLRWLLDKYDIAYRLFGPQRARRIAIRKDSVVRFRIAPPAYAEAA